MSNTTSVFAATAKKALIAAGFVAALSTAGFAGVASATTDESGTVQCEHAGVTISCPVGAVADGDGTQGEWRQGTQGESRTGSQGETRSGSQGTQDDDGFQGAYAYGSTYAFPQYR